MFAVLILWVHLSAAVAWIGGMLFSRLVLNPVLNAGGIPQKDDLVARIEARFRSLRWAGLITLVGTGAYNLIHEGGSARLESAWGGILLIKLLFVAIAIGLTGINDYLLHGPPSDHIKDGLNGLILLLGLLIVLIAVYLGQF
jgi:uncharacterized membrane protein